MPSGIPRTLSKRSSSDSLWTVPMTIEPTVLKTHAAHEERGHARAEPGGARRQRARQRTGVQRGERQKRTALRDERHGEPSAEADDRAQQDDGDDDEVGHSSWSL